MASMIDDRPHITERYPACLSRERVAKLVRSLLSQGMHPAIFTGENFSWLVALDDHDLVRTVYERGVSISPTDYPELYRRAKSMAMVKWLQSQGMELTREQYVKLLARHDKFTAIPPVSPFVTPLVTASPDVLDYYRSRAR